MSSVVISSAVLMLSLSFIALIFGNEIACGYYLKVSMLALSRFAKDDIYKKVSNQTCLAIYIAAAE